MIFRLRDYAWNPFEIKRFRDFLEVSQQWDAAQRRAWVQERLDETLRHAVRRVPYYRRTLRCFEADFAGMIERLDLSPLPILTKEQVRRHYRELIAEDAAAYHPTETHTSGSSGTPTRFLLARKCHVVQFASIWRVLNWAGYRFGDRFADLTGYLPRNDGLFAYNPRLNCLHLSSSNFKRENIGICVARLRKFNARLFKGYPSALDLLCRWMRETDADLVYRPPAVITCAETLLDHQRRTIEEVLQCPVFDFYNQNERVALISTCEQGTYHVHPEYSHVEYEQPDTDGFGSPLFATTFHNRAMPLIRYHTGDLVKQSAAAACGCGRSFAAVAQIIGRVEDVVVTPDGRHVGRLDRAFQWSSGVRLGQVVQDTVEAIRVRVVKASNFQRRDVDTIERELRARLGDRIGIEFEFVDTIEPGPNGKIKFVVSVPGRQALGAGARPGGS